MVQISDGIVKNGFPACLVNIGMEQDIGHKFQAFVTYVFLLHHVDHGIILGEYFINVKRQFRLAELGLDIGYSTPGLTILEQSQTNGNLQEQFPYAVYLSKNKVFHIK